MAKRYFTFLSFYRKKDSYRIVADDIEVCMVNKAGRVARYALMFAAIIVATLVDRVITLGLPIAGATVELLVTFVLCFLFNSWLDGFLAFAFMGLSSFVLAFPFSKVSSQNPLISVVPRLVVGVVAFGVYRLVLWLTRKSDKQRACQVAAMCAATAVGLVTNTVLFLGALTLFTDMYGSLVLAIQSLVVINILPEYTLAFVGVAPIVLGVRRGLKLGIDGNNPKRGSGVTNTDSGTQKTYTYQQNDDKTAHLNGENE